MTCRNNSNRMKYDFALILPIFKESFPLRLPLFPEVCRLSDSLEIEENQHSS